MGRYLVELKEIEIYHVEIEAEDEDEAKIKATDKYIDGSGSERAEWHNDSDSESSVIQDL